MAIGATWGDPLGGLLVGCFLRLVVQWHVTFSVNSFAHLFGRQTYSATSTARDSVLLALVTLGEGYHNFHHRFQADYRNGVRWRDFDPTKWWIWLTMTPPMRSSASGPDAVLRDSQNPRLLKPKR